MAKFSGETLDWLSKLETTKRLRNEDPDLSGIQLAQKLECSTAHASYISSLSDCLDQAAIDKIRQATQGNPPFILSFNSARALAGLTKAKTTDLPGTVHPALDVVLSRRLTTVQIEALVDWLVQGNSLETFKEPEAGKKGKTKANQKAAKAKNQPTPVDGKLAALFKQVEESTGEDKIKAQAQLVAYVAGQSTETQEDGEGKSSPQKSSGISSSKRNQKTSSGNQPDDWFWEMLLGVKFVSQLRSRAKKGELTTTDKVLVLLYFVLYKPFEVIFKFLGKLFKESAKESWHWLKHTLGKTFSQIIQWAVPLLIICAIIWGAGKVYQYAIVNPLHWVEAEIKSGFHFGGHSEEQPTPVPNANVLNHETLAQPTPVSRPVVEIQAPTPKPAVAYQPSIAFNTSASPSDSTSATTLYDPKLLAEEISALPQNCIVKSFPVLTDEGMPGDLAVSRIQSVTDPDRYTLIINGDKKIIENIATTTTNLIINYKSADPLKFLDGAGQLNHIWEDLLYIHTDEIEVENKTPYKIFQLSLVVSGAKHVMTIQCASADDLKHLVSALEYFIRNSRLGHDTALAGLPYPSQGVVLDNHWVEKLWAGSPMDKAGIKLNDLIWSLDKDTQSPQDDKKLKAQLDALTSGPHPLFIYSPSASDNLGIDQNEFHTGNFSPKRRRIILTVLLTDAD